LFKKELKAAKRRIGGVRKYNASNKPYGLVGHLFAAVHGRVGEEGDLNRVTTVGWGTTVEGMNQDHYVDLVRLVARANGIYDRQPVYRLVDALTELSSNTGSLERDRAKAINMLDAAIALEEAELAADRIQAANEGFRS
jgi:hypothetical protein